MPLISGLTAVAQTMNAWTYCFHFGSSIIFFRGLPLDCWKIQSIKPITAVWANPEAFTALCSCCMSPPWSWTPKLWSIVVLELESCIMFSREAEQKKKGGRECVFTQPKASCIQYVADSCYVTNQTEEETEGSTRRYTNQDIWEKISKEQVERGIWEEKIKKAADAGTVVPGQSQGLRHHTSIPPACHLALSFTNTTTQPEAPPSDTPSFQFSRPTYRAHLEPPSFSTTQKTTRRIPT